MFQLHKHTQFTRNVNLNVMQFNIKYKFFKSYTFRNFIFFAYFLFYTINLQSLLTLWCSHKDWFSNRRTMNNINNKIVAKMRTLGKRKSGKGIKRGEKESGRDGYRENVYRRSGFTFLYSTLFHKYNASTANQRTVTYKQ